jgi:hypothetical protein
MSEWTRRATWTERTSSSKLVVPRRPREAKQSQSCGGELRVQRGHVPGEL